MMISMCSLVFQDGICNTIPCTLYKCQEVFGKLYAVNLPMLINIFQIFQARWNRSDTYLASALLVRLHIGGGSQYTMQYLVY